MVHRSQSAYKAGMGIWVIEDELESVIGPTFLGRIRLGIKRQLKWKAGAIFGLDKKSPNQTLRLLLVLEF